MEQYYTECVAGFVVGDTYNSFATCWLKVDTLLNTWKEDPTGAIPETLRDIWQGLGDIDVISMPLLEVAAKINGFGESGLYRKPYFQFVFSPPQPL